MTTDGTQISNSRIVYLIKKFQIDNSLMYLGLHGFLGILVGSAIFDLGPRTIVSMNTDIPVMDLSIFSDWTIAILGSWIALFVVLIKTWIPVFRKQHAGLFFLYGGLISFAFAIAYGLRIGVEAIFSIDTNSIISKDSAARYISKYMNTMTLFALGVVPLWLGTNKHGDA